jgi:hypothetical protein
VLVNAPQQLLLSQSPRGGGDGLPLVQYDRRPSSILAAGVS